MADSQESKGPNQAQKFKDAARELGTDENEARWEERLKKVAKQKPAQKPDEPAT